MMPDWVNEFNGNAMVCDKDGIIVYMNGKATLTYGEGLVGKNVLDCHPAVAKAKLLQMLEDRKPNTYTIEKGSIKKLVHQAPWYAQGEYKGFIEIVIEIPFDIPHYVRTVK